MSKYGWLVWSSGLGVRFGFWVKSAGPTIELIKAAGCDLDSNPQGGICFKTLSGFCQLMGAIMSSLIWVGEARRG